jgi:hypothetical protein
MIFIFDIFGIPREDTIYNQKLIIDYIKLKTDYEQKKYKQPNYI